MTAPPLYVNGQALRLGKSGDAAIDSDRVIRMLFLDREHQRMVERWHLTVFLR